MSKILRFLCVLPFFAIQTLFSRDVLLEFKAAKIGSYFDLPHNFFADVFLDYSFVKVGCSNYCARVVPLKVNLSSVIVGVGLGYRFN